ncbi:hypothetical protein [Candidatus Ruthturnera calyptogenae]|nr:hypothetical protein [Candidatus Ruthturnera calyptogenae]
MTKDTNYGVLVKIGNYWFHVLYQQRFLNPTQTQANWLKTTLAINLEAF